MCVSGMPVFSLKGQRSRSQDVKISELWRHVYLRADQAWQAPSENQAYAIVRPNSLSAPETPGMDARHLKRQTDKCAAASSVRALRAANTRVGRCLRHFSVCDPGERDGRARTMSARTSVIVHEPDLKIWHLTIKLVNRSNHDFWLA